MRIPTGRSRSRAGPLVRLAVAMTLACFSLLAAGPATGAGVRIVAIEPTWSGAGLLCGIRTSGLPDPASRETLESGLPSAMTLSLALLDRRGRERGVTTVEMRIEPDLWEGTIMLRSPAGARRAAGMAELVSLIGRLGPFAVMPASSFDPAEPLRLRARLTVHPLAPAEAAQVHELFGGETGSGDADRREVSAGLGSLLRFFLGRRPVTSWAAEGLSASFTLEALSAPRAEGTP